MKRFPHFSSFIMLGKKNQFHSTTVKNYFIPNSIDRTYTVSLNSSNALFYGMVWTGSIWLRIGTSGGLL
jgi:hypothetical protein